MSLLVGTTRPPAPPACGSPAGEVPAAVDRQAVLVTITELIASQGRPPTRRELLLHLGLSSHRQLTEALAGLVRDGRLRRLAGSRGLIVPRPSEATE